MFAAALALDGYVESAKGAIQVLGGMGFTWEVDVHLYLKRAWVLDTHFASADSSSRIVCSAAGRAARKREVS